MNKSLMYLIYFAFYTFVLLWFGKGGFKRTKDNRDFFVAGSSLGLKASIFTFTATWFSAASMQGLTGTLYAYGYSVILYSVVGWFLGAIFLVFMAAKLKDYDIVTVPEYFRIRYNSRLLQGLGGLVIVICYILYIIIQIRGFGIVMSELLDINYTLSIFLVYLFVIYTTFGGLFSVTRTDGLNFILLFIGTILAAFIILKDIGGITLMNQKAGLIATKPFPDFPHVIEKGGLLDPFCNGLQRPSMIFTVCLAWGLGLAANPQYAIRVSSAKDKKTAVKMISFSVLILAVIYVGILVIGIGARVLEPSVASIASVDEIFPYIINNVIYSPLSGFILISIAAAAISTANSQLLILASGFSYDIYKNFINPKISEEKLLNLNRLSIFLAGTISLILSIKPPTSLLIYGSYIWGIFSVTFLLPLYGGLYWKRATKEGAMASFIGGLITISIFFAINTLIKPSDIVIHPVLPAVVVSLILFYVVSKRTYDKKKVIDNEVGYRK
ncbi:sodium:solute symporter family protein [Wukongibacter baidiensis]|uniref:sodium:solute symporter family protein n=1 Tax=Wukongibacter baidiensis TaxID=1723361 RepID=UPI003D7F36CA